MSPRPRSACSCCRLSCSPAWRAQAEALPKLDRHALLIGVTNYPKLDSSLWLEGGANDVLLMHRLLTEKLGFAHAVVILSEAEGAKDPKKLPTRENIKRECEELAPRVPAGGQGAGGYVRAWQPSAGKAPRSRTRNRTGSTRSSCRATPRSST